MPGPAKISPQSPVASVASELTMQSDQHTLASDFQIHDVEKEENKVDEDPHGPIKHDDPPYPDIGRHLEDEYETDGSSDMDDVVDGVLQPKKKKKKVLDEASALASKKSGKFLKLRNEAKAQTTQRILGQIMPQFEEYKALDQPPPHKPPGKCMSFLTRLGKFWGCVRLDIHEAVLSGSEKHIDSTLEFIHQGKKSNRAKINVYNREGYTALSLAVKSRQLPMVFAILARKVEPDVPDLDSGRTPLFYACTLGDFNMNRILLQNGADPNYGDFDCVTPLMMAAGKNDEATVRFMCNSVIKILDMDLQDLNGWTALHYAAYRNGFRAIKVLLENGANRDLRDVNGRKALHIAKHFERNDCIAALEDIKSRMARVDGDDD